MNFDSKAGRSMMLYTESLKCVPSSLLIAKVCRGGRAYLTKRIGFRVYLKLRIIPLHSFNMPFRHMPFHTLES